MRVRTESILPITRMPTGKELEHAMTQSEGNIETAEYFLQRLKKLLDNSKEAKANPDVASNMMSIATKFVEAVKFKLTARNQPWAGETAETNAEKNQYMNIAEAMAKQLAGKMTNVRLDYAVSREGKFIRGYASPEGAVKGDDVAAMDRIFNAFLMSKDLVINEGFIYQVSNGTQTKLSGDAVKKLMAEGGYEEYMQGKGINIVRAERDFPGEEATQKLKQDAAKTAESEQATAPSTTGGAR